MALTKSSEIYYRDWIDRIEHHTQKKILSWERCYDRFGFYVYFTDQTMLYFAEGGALPEDPSELKYQPIPGSICASCGEKRHGAAFYNWKGQCTLTVKHFWEKVRTVFWHRYTKNGKL